MRADAHSSSVLTRSWRTVTVARGRHADASLAARAALLGHDGIGFTSHDLYLVAGCDDDGLERLVAELLAEPCGAAPVTDTSNPADDGTVRVEVARRPGVTDRVAAQMEESARGLGIEVRVSTGAVYLLSGNVPDGDRLRDLIDGLLCNPVIETWSTASVAPGFVDAVDATDHDIPVVAVRGLDDAALAALNSARGLALDPAELRAVRDWFTAEGRDPTDAELETLAQTWSEHCAHKTFTAVVETADGEMAPLLRQLRDTTREIDAPFVVSAFDGNAGIVRFGSMRPLAVKVETHNHPSAVEPFGGANTGVGGVVRDVLAAPARPVALTDVLCFGPRGTDPADLPRGVLHPAVIEEGVVAGVADYGNKIGVPTVAGAVLYDPGYTGNPLVFCGCIGEVMAGQPSIGSPRTGDRVVVIGGATGRDGIKGATFSSMTMDATTGEVAGASVQIGDPIVERLVGEVLVELLDREQPLCTAITDCGAGGLSSAVGEMAEELGATVQMRDVARKYPGLAPWEVWLSEAQERMVLAVAPSDMAAVRTVCAQRGVTCTDIGEFTGNGRMTVLDGARILVDLPTAFMHDGRPQRRMRAEFPDRTAPARGRTVDDHRATVLALLAHPTIASKEPVVRRYDHEILGATVVGPMSAPHQTGPSDGTVIARPDSAEGFAVGVGVNPQYGRFDPLAMAWAAVDEAVRNVVVAGADPGAVALLDNFSWGDPRRHETMGDLVLAVRGCCEAARAYRAPFVSGKDSLNNEYEGTDGVRRAVPPTLVITALAHVPDADAVPGVGLTGEGNVLVLAGHTDIELRGSHLDLVLGDDLGGVVPQPDMSAPSRYAVVHTLLRGGVVRSAHDVSEGGVAVAVAEMVLASGGCGATLEAAAVHPDPVAALYSESTGRIILEVGADDAARVVEILGTAAVVGRVTGDGNLRVDTAGAATVIPRRELSAAWAPHTTEPAR
ncbi:MAG: phosphoribosylformylglycinamidine synthase subunit PurL [Acidimicrobiales bacterium]